MTPILKINAVQVLALAACGLLIGSWIKRKLPLLERINIPASIVGGLVYSLAIMALRGRVVNFEFDLLLRDILMVAFFTTIGLSASVGVMRAGGVQGIVYLVLASAGALLQNVVGIALAKRMGLDPLLGIITGSAALAGGPATSLAFGPSFEALGVAGATSLGLASATFGFAVAGVLGGFIGGQLIRGRGLRPAPFKAAAVERRSETAAGAEESSLLNVVVVLAIAMGIGSVISAGIERMGLILPAYIGAMIVAAVIRNANDRWRIASISELQVESVGNVSLHMFVVIALLGLRLWELVHLALPVLALLAVQVVLVWIVCLTVVFWVMGRDYESAVMSCGFCGFMLGSTANAMASMSELARKYGPAPQAFIVVPIVGGFLIDFVNALIITSLANVLR